jgi:hypothetical protein
MKKRPVPELKNVHRNAGIRRVIANEPCTSGAWLCAIDLNQIRLDLNMRKLDPRHVNRIVTEYDNQAVNDPVVTFWHRKVQSINGQHTVDAVALARPDLDEVTACVFFGMSPVRAARIFYLQSAGTKRMNKQAEYRAAVRGEMAWALAIEACLEEYDFKSLKDYGAKADFPHYLPLKEAYDKGQLERLVALSVAWVDEIDEDRYSLAKEAHSCPWLKGLLDFLVQYHDVELEDLIEAMAPHYAADITRSANKAAWRDGTGRTERHHYRKQFEKLYLEWEKAQRSKHRLAA